MNTKKPQPFSFRNRISRPFLIFLMIFGIIEGISTLVLFFIAMPLKYVGGIPEPVTISGWIHGYLFIGLVLLFLIGWFLIPLNWRMVILGIIAAIVPFGPFYVDWKLNQKLRAESSN